MRTQATYFKLGANQFPIKYVAVNRSYSLWFRDNYSPINVIYEFFAKVINPIDLSKVGLDEITPNVFKVLIEELYGYTITTNLMASDTPQKIWQILRANPDMLREIKNNTNFDGWILYENNPSDHLPSGEENTTKDFAIYSNTQLKSANVNTTFFNNAEDFRFEDGGEILN